MSLHWSATVIEIQIKFGLISSQNVVHPLTSKWQLVAGIGAIAFFLSTETHAKRLLTIWKRSIWTTLKRSFAVLANQIIVSETFQAFRILANQFSVRKTLSWKPCLVANVLSFAFLVNQNPADSIYLRFFFFFFFFFFQFHLIIITIQVTVLQM